MSFVSDSVIILVWFLIFVVILFLYVDVRVGKLRKELLSHYAMCEKMLQSQRGNTAYRCDVTDPYMMSNDRRTSTDDIFPRVVPAPIDDEFIPTRQEMAQGLLNLDKMGGMHDWMVTPPQQQPAAFGTWNQGDYAPFRIPV